MAGFGGYGRDRLREFYERGAAAQRAVDEITRNLPQQQATKKKSTRKRQAPKAR